MTALKAKTEALGFVAGESVLWGKGTILAQVKRVEINGMVTLHNLKFIAGPGVGREVHFNEVIGRPVEELAIA